MTDTTHNDSLSQPWWRRMFALGMFPPRWPVVEEEQPPRPLQDIPVFQMRLAARAWRGTSPRHPTHDRIDDLIEEVERLRQLLASPAVEAIEGDTP